MRNDKRSRGTSDARSRASKDDSGEKQDDDKDIHHDAFLIVASASLEQLAASVFEQCEELRSEGAKQKPRRDALEVRRRLSSNIIANLTALYETANVQGWLIMTMGQLKKTRYDHPKYHAKVLRGQIELLEATGWIVRKEAVFKKLRTKIRPTEHLLEHLSNLGSGPHVGRESGGESIVLRTNSLDGPSKLLVDYRDSPETERLRAEMDVLNESIKNADLRFAGKPITWTRLARNFLTDGLEAPYRFDQVGRLSGGFWMSLPKQQRGLITLEGEKLCDLDIQASFVSLAYCEIGTSQPQGEAYGGVEGLTRKDQKLGLLALLCRTGPMLRLPDEIAHLSAVGWTGPKFESAMKLRHPAISGLFGKGVGLRLMWLESCVLVEALLALAQIDVPALGMHDGLMVAESKEVAAREAMVEASRRILGDPLTIISEPVSSVTITTSSH